METFAIENSEKTKPIQNQFQNVGLGEIWIHAFAGMTNMKFMDDGIFQSDLKKQSQFRKEINGRKHLLKK